MFRKNFVKVSVFWPTHPTCALMGGWNLTWRSRPWCNVSPLGEYLQNCPFDLILQLALCTVLAVTSKIQLTYNVFWIYVSLTCNFFIPSMLWRCWLGSWKGIRPVKNWVVGGWHGYLSGARCRLAYGPADATATHCLLLHKNPDWCYLSGTSSPG